MILLSSPLVPKPPRPNLKPQLSSPVPKPNTYPITFRVGWVGWVVAHKILVSAPVPSELIWTGFDWVGTGPWGFGFWDGA